MPIDEGYRDFISNADMMAQPILPESSLGENFAASVGEMFDEYSSFSPMLNNANLGERDDSIKTLIESGRIPPEVIKERQKWNTNGRIPRKENDYSAIAEWVNENLDMDAQLHTDEELKQFRNDEMEMKRKYREDIFARATTGGKVVQFGGSLLGGSLDPVAIAGGFFTGGAKVGAIAASRALYAKSVAIRAGIGGVASQAAVEPFIWAWQEESDGDYTVKQSIANLALAGVFNATLSGTAAIFGHGSALKKEALRAKKIELLEENLAFKNVDSLVESARLHHKETTLELEKKLDRLPEGSEEIDAIQMRLMEEDTKLENFLLQAESGPKEMVKLARMFDELEILKDVDGKGISLEAKYTAVEEAAERMRTLAKTADDSPPKLPPKPTQATKRQRAVIEQKKKEQQALLDKADKQEKPEPKVAKKTTKKKAAKEVPLKDQDPLSMNVATAHRRYQDMKKDLQKLYDNTGEAKAKYAQERTIKDLERKVEFMKAKIRKNNDPDTLPDLEDQLEDFMSDLEMARDPDFQLDEEAMYAMSERFNTYHSKQIADKIVEIKNMEKSLGIEAKKDPIDEAVDGIDDEVVYIDDAGEPQHITKVVDEAETLQEVFQDAMTCVTRNNLG